MKQGLSFFALYHDAMSKKIVYLPRQSRPYYTAVSNYKEKFPDLKPLKLSGSLSPDRLLLTLDTLHKAFPVETIYLASLIKPHGGPFYDLLGCDPEAAPKDERLTGETVGLQLEGVRYEASEQSLFYDWLYCMALLENGYGHEILKQEAFSSPDGKAAQAAAICKSLLYERKLHAGMDFEEFCALWQHVPEMAPAAPGKIIKPKRTVFNVGDWLEHPGIGTGEVIKRTARDYTIMFRVSGPKTLRKDIVETKCRKL